METAHCLNSRRARHGSLYLALGLTWGTAGGVHAADLEWSSLGSLPTSAIAEGAFVTVIDNRLVVAGGLERVPGSPDTVATPNAWVLDGPAAAWRPTTPLPEAVAFGTASSCGTFAVFTGGTRGNDAGYLATTYRVRFEGRDLVHEELPALPEPRSRSGSACIGSTVYLACGLVQAVSPQPTSDILLLDLESPEPGWERAPALPGPARHSAGVSALEGAIHLFGGSPSASAGDMNLVPLADAYRFTLEAGWSEVAPSPSPTLGPAVPIGSAHAVVMAGTPAAPRGALAYHAITDTWVSLGDSPAGVAGAASANWHDQIVAITPGLNDPNDTAKLVTASLGTTPSRFRGLDYVTLIAYLVVLVMMGIYFAGKGSTTEDFFLAGRSMPWWATGLSIFGTQLSSISFMAVPAKVYATDWVYFLLQMTIVMIAFPVVFLYLPYFRRVRMTSAYEYLESRFNLPVRMYASVSFVLYQVGRMSIVLFLPAIALSTVTGFSVYTCIITMGALSTLYTVMGGMKAVIWTDVIQVFVLYGGALLSLGILLTNLDGGISGLISEGLSHDKFHMFNWTWDWTTSAVWVVVVGNLFLNLVPYTSDQAVVQRYFTTKDERAAARSIWTNAILIVPSTLTLFLLGTGLWAFYRSNPTLLDPTLPTDSIFPLFISQQLPAGLVGLLIAAVFAASMSTLDSSLNSISAALVTDFFVRFRPTSSERKRLVLARWLTAGLGTLATATSIALATFDIGSLWDTFQGMMGLLGGGLAGLFALGMFFRSANGSGALAGALSSVLILYWVQQHTDLHFFLYGAVGVLSCVLIGVAASPILGNTRSELASEDDPFTA